MNSVIVKKRLKRLKD